MIGLNLNETLFDPCHLFKKEITLLFKYDKFLINNFIYKLKKNCEI